MFRLLSSLVGMGLTAIGCWWVWENVPEVRQAVPELESFVQSKFQAGEFFTLEARYTPQQVMSNHAADLLKSPGQKFLEPKEEYYPYLLMEIKYSRGPDSTGEGVILWGMNNGEMVLDTGSWRISHGFEDCINVGATNEDFKVLNSLASTGSNSMDRATLLNSLHVEPAVLDIWLEEVLRKQLVVQSGNQYRLHFDRPVINVQPETRMAQELVTKAYLGTTRISSRYSRAQIEGIAKARFGSDFTIRSVTEVYLPIYNLEVENPDGSVHTSYWNALSGKRFSAVLVR